MFSSKGILHVNFERPGNMLISAAAPPLKVSNNPVFDYFPIFNFSRDGNSVSRRVCTICVPRQKQTYSTGSSTTTLMEHLQNKHNISLKNHEEVEESEESSFQTLISEYSLCPCFQNSNRGTVTIPF
ncbi:hypothetical protein RCL1_002352 [Eukaryota sp. TZLM3-RCL]